jgi:hypothetical protein
MIDRKRVHELAERDQARHYPRALRRLAEILDDYEPDFQAIERILIEVKTEVKDVQAIAGDVQRHIGIDTWRRVMAISIAESRLNISREESMRLRTRAFDVIGRIPRHEKIVAIRVNSSPEEYMRLRSRAFDALGRIPRHEKIVAIRVRTRGHMSEAHLELRRRSTRMKEIFLKFVDPARVVEGHDIIIVDPARN